MGTLIARFLPSFTLRQVDHLAVAADPQQAWAYARSVDLHRLGVARQLFGLRLLPERVGARLRGAPAAGSPSARIEDFTRAGMGFQILGEEPGREIAVGAVGRFWQPRIEFASVLPEEFASYAAPGMGKVAWSIAVAPRQAGGAWITVEVRVQVADARARRRFQRYWALIGPFSHAIRRSFLRRARAELGPAGDQTRPLPGDELLAHPRFQVTHAVDIEATPAQVWPWLVQMGGNRAGWYSWDALDHDGEPSASALIPGLQRLAAGDLIAALPDGTRSFAVLQVDPGRALVLGSPALLPGGAPQPDEPEPFQDTWAFSLEPVGDGATHLAVRVRAAYERSASTAALRVALPLAHEIMERRQLHNLKLRAELKH